MRENNNHYSIISLNINGLNSLIKRQKNRLDTYKGTTIRITPGSSTETMKARRSWEDVIQTLREQTCQPRLLYPAKLSMK